MTDAEADCFSVGSEVSFSIFNHMQPDRAQDQDSASAGSGGAPGAVEPLRA